jgi:hypothetical protein
MRSAAVHLVHRVGFAALLTSIAAGCASGGTASEPASTGSNTIDPTSTGTGSQGGAGQGGATTSGTGGSATTTSAGGSGQGGQAQGGSPNTGCKDNAGCDDDNSCTLDTCSSGVCQHQGLPTDDGNPCTTDTCDPKTGITHAPVPVDDSNACTIDACDPVKGIVHTPAPIDDGDACTTDTCDPKTGVTHTLIPVDDGNICTIDACDPKAGITHSPVPMDDGNACTADTCDPKTGVTHTPLPIDDGSVCTIDACDPKVGVTHTPVPTDDGNACTADACDPKLGVTHTPVKVDDGDPCTVDSCDPKVGVSHAPLCAANQVCNAGVCSQAGGNPKVFLASSNGTAGFWGYDVASNTWSTLTNPPAVTYSQLTTDGTYVYEMGSDNVVYKYAPASGTWSVVQSGPGNMTANAIALFKYANGTFYYAKDGGTTLYWSSGGAWTSVATPAATSCAGTYDAASGNIYIREYGNLGVSIFSTVTKSVTKRWPNATSVGENSRTGTFYGGFFYERDWSAPFTKVDMTTGVATVTGITPTEGHTSTDVNAATGDIYVGPYTPTGQTFQVYKTASNTLTTLAPLPVAMNNHSTIVYVAGGGGAKKLVGQYNVSDGPAWGGGPPAYTCLQACALVFGGNAADYACSTQAGVIDHKAWEDGWGDSSHCAGQNNPVAENYSLGGNNYNCGAQSCSFSAYVNDHGACGSNYCWK